MTPELIQVSGIALAQAVADQIRRDGVDLPPPPRTIAFLDASGQLTMHGLSSSNPNVELAALVKSQQLSSWVDFGLGTVPGDGGERVPALVLGLRPSVEGPSLPLYLPYTQEPFRLLPPTVSLEGDAKLLLLKAVTMHPESSRVMPYLLPLMAYGDDAMARDVAANPGNYPGPDDPRRASAGSRGSTQVHAKLRHIVLAGDMLLRLKPDGSVHDAIAIEGVSIGWRRFEERQGLLGVFGVGKVVQRVVLTLKGASQNLSWQVPGDVTDEEVEAFIAAIWRVQEGGGATDDSAEAAGPFQPSHSPPADEAWVVSTSPLPPAPTEGWLIEAWTTQDAIQPALKAIVELQKHRMEDPRCRPDVLALAFTVQPLRAGAPAGAARVPYDDPDALWRWLAGATALVITPGPVVRDSAGRVLLAAEGAPDPDAEHLSQADAIARRRRTVAALTDQGYPVIGLPPYHEEIAPRDPREVLDRGLALITASTLASAPLMGHAVPDLDGEHPPVIQAQISKLLASERSALQSGDEQRLGMLQWGIESGRALLWAVGEIDALGDAKTKTEGQDESAALVRDRTDDEAPSLRSESELRDALDDLHCRHWATVDAMANGRGAPSQLHNGLLVKLRLEALCWVTGYLQTDPPAAWGEIELST